MKYVVIEKIKEGMVLAKDLKSDKGKILLKKNVVLDDFYLDFICKQGIESVCIKEDKDSNIKEPSNMEKLVLKQDVKNEYKETFKFTTSDENMMIFFDAIIENEVRKRIYG
jgi:hypothetical protein